ncbi:nucleolar protein [Tieghemiomyces parasiticus]|uniref:Nucleolar protein n=1 Tax=Tieghemiomyces parasiticus TaxID=78921 RepID=A0A9W8DRF0_9FUNG|nr:nucleolar protein [Tieghemiomyces parasiticus]
MPPAKRKASKAATSELGTSAPAAKTAKLSKLIKKVKASQSKVTVSEPQVEAEITTTTTETQVTTAVAAPAEQKGKGKGKRKRKQPAEPTEEELKVQAAQAAILQQFEDEASSSDSSDEEGKDQFASQAPVISFEEDSEAEFDAQVAEVEAEAEAEVDSDTEAMATSDDDGDDEDPDQATEDSAAAQKKLDSRLGDYVDIVEDFDLDEALKQLPAPPLSKAAAARKAARADRPTYRLRRLLGGGEAGRPYRFDEGAILHVKHLPRKFQEPELRKYFSQFGHLGRVRLARHPITAASRHFGYVEFYSPEAAQIAAETMNGYIMDQFHTLACDVMAPETVHPRTMITDYRLPRTSERAQELKKKLGPNYQSALNKVKASKRARKAKQAQ